MYSIIPIIELKSLLFPNICFVEVHTSCPKLNHVMVDFTNPGPLTSCFTFVYHLTTPTLGFAKMSTQVLVLENLSLTASV